jgi:hypothetical protein
MGDSVQHDSPDYCIVLTDTGSDKIREKVPEIDHFAREYV